MLRRPPTTLQLTQEDITAYDTSRAQRQQLKRQQQKLQQQTQKQQSKPILSPPPAPPTEHMEEGDTEPEESVEDDEGEEELDNSHLAARQRPQSNDPGAPQRRPQQSQTQRFMERAPPPPFLRPPTAPSRYERNETNERARREERGADQGDEEMHDLETPTALPQHAAAARRARPKGIPPQDPTMLDGAGDIGSSRGHAEVHRRRYVSSDAGTQQSREARERLARERVMGMGDNAAPRGVGARAAVSGSYGGRGRAADHR